MTNMTLQALRDLVKDDAYASSYQSLAHYRGALLRHFDSLTAGLDKKPAAGVTSAQMIVPITSLNDPRIYTTAIAVKVDDRWFSSVGKSGRIQTAFSLAGAKLIVGTKFGIADAVAIAELVKAKRPRSIVVVKMLNAIDDISEALSADGRRVPAERNNECGAENA